MLIDPTTDIGKVRLRCGDWTDTPMMPDSVYQSAIADCQGNLPKASVLVAQYILAALSFRVRERMGVLEVFGSDYHRQYVEFLKLTVLNPNLMTLAPIPYAGGLDSTHPILQFQKDWNNNYSSGTEADQLHFTAYGVKPNGFF